MAHYVTEQMLDCIEKNKVFPQDIQVTKTQYLTFGAVGLSLTKFTSKGAYMKHLRAYRGETASAINARLNDAEWEKVPE